MKTIIAGTDFSPSSYNACKYAAMLAQKLNCKLVLFNLFESPIIHSNIGMYGIEYTDTRKSSQNKTAKIIKDLGILFPDVKISSFVSGGSFKEELKKFTKAHHVEAVIMGLEAKDKLTKFIYGSHGVEIAGKIPAPVIIIPEKYTEHYLEEILLAVDNSEKIHKTVFTDLANIALKVKAKIEVLHIRTANELITTAQNVVKIGNYKYDIETTKAKNLKNGIKNYCKHKPVDLIAIVSKRHSAFYNLFAESNTKKIAFDAKVPVMAIHE